jgi:hypothetical protein
MDVERWGYKVSVSEWASCDKDGVLGVVEWHATIIKMAVTMVRMVMKCFII